MDTWITRFAALLCAAGATALFWSFGMFVAIPWREGRMLAMNAVEMQVVAIPLVTGFAVGWGALHLFSLASDEENPQRGRVRLAVFALVALAAIAGGLSWTLGRVVS